MDKREIFVALDGFSQNLLMTLAEVDAIKKHLQGVIDENTALRLENSKLRDRLSRDEKEDTKTSNYGRKTWKISMKTAFIFVPFPMDSAVTMMSPACSA